MLNVCILDCVYLCGSVCRYMHKSVFKSWVVLRLESVVSCLICGCWEWKVGLLQEQCMLLNSKPSFQPFVTLDHPLSLKGHPLAPGSSGSLQDMLLSDKVPSWQVPGSALELCFPSALRMRVQEFCSVCSLLPYLVTIASISITVVFCFEVHTEVR